jgi:hypothetical protein
LVKVMLLALPNCGSDSATPEENYATALHTCRDQYSSWLKRNGAVSRQEEKRLGLPRHTHRLPEGYTCGFILDALIAKHHAISDRFFTGRGVYLQATDAKIACHILLSFAKLGRACIGVHDSFIVKEQDGELLRRMMTSAYRNHIGMAPIIEAKSKSPDVYAYANIMVGGFAEVHHVQISADV